MALTVNTNTCRVGVNTKQPRRWYSFATSPCKSIHSILHAGLASNHSRFRGRALYQSNQQSIFFEQRPIFCQALITSPVSCIFTVNTAQDRVVTVCKANPMDVAFTGKTAARCQQVFLHTLY